VVDKHKPPIGELFAATGAKHLNSFAEIPGPATVSAPDNLGNVNSVKEERVYIVDLFTAHIATVKKERTRLTAYSYLKTSPIPLRIGSNEYINMSRRD
jgi:hypothetical protein